MQDRLQSILYFLIPATFLTDKSYSVSFRGISSKRKHDAQNERLKSLSVKSLLKRAIGFSYHFFSYYGIFIWCHVSK